MLSRASTAAGAEQVLARALSGFVFSPAGMRPCEMPAGPPAWFDAAVADCETAVPGYGLSLLSALLLEPLASYEATSESGQREVVLVAAVDAGGSEKLVVGRTRCPFERTRATGWGTFTLEVADVSREEETQRTLVGVASSLTERSFNARTAEPPIRALLVGELAAPEREAFRVKLWTYGYRLEKLLAEPVRRMDGTRRAVSGYSGDVVIIAARRCGDAVGGLTAAVSDPVRRMIYLEETEVDDLIVECGIVLPDWSRPQEGTTLEGQRDDVNNWSDARKAIERLESDAFVLTESAKNCIKGNPTYPFPGRMVGDVEKLASLAEEWCANRGSVGGSLVVHARTSYELQIAMKDEQLVRAGLQVFEFEGASLSREPHVQVDQRVPFDECGRIYFALDTANWRFVVDHIGLHLYRPIGW